MNLVSVLETCLYAEDLKAAQEFYQNELGLNLDSSSEGRFLFFKLRDSMLLIFNPKATQSQTGHVNGSVIPAHGAVGAGHVAFKIEESEIQNCLDLLKKKNIPIESDVYWPSGGRSIYVRDPAGNSIEFATAQIWFCEPD